VGHLAVLAVLWIGVPLVSIYVGMLPGAAIILAVVAYYSWAESPSRKLVGKRNSSGSAAR
jgi:hypothetical protein